MVSSGTILYPQGMLQDVVSLNEPGMMVCLILYVWSCWICWIRLLFGDSRSIFSMFFFKWELLILTLFFPPSLMIITDPIGIAGDGLTFCCRPVGCTNGMLTDQPRASCVSRWQLGPGRSTHRVNILLIENSGGPGLQLSLFLMERTFVIHGFSWFGWIGNDGQLLLHMTRS